MCLPARGAITSLPVEGNTEGALTRKEEGAREHRHMSIMSFGVAPPFVSPTKDMFSLLGYSHLSMSLNEWKCHL